MRMIRVAILLVSLGLLAGVPGAALAGGGVRGGLCAGFAAGSTLIMRDSCFEGVAHFVDTGSTLLVRNDGEAPHSLTAIDGSFDTGLLDPGQAAEIPLAAAGIVPVYCTLHGTVEGQGMAGILVVGDPEPKSLGAVGAGGDVRVALDEHDSAVLGKLEAQALALDELQAEVAGLKQAVTSDTAAAPPAQASMLGLAGVLIGGAAVAAVLTRRRATPSQGETRSE